MKRFTQLLVAGFLFSLPALLAAAPAPPVSATETYKRAVDLVEQKKYDEAAAAFAKADRETGGGCGPCQLGLARAYTGLGEADKAAGAARRATETLERADLRAQAWNQLGMALVVKRKPDLPGAEEAFRKVLEVGGGTGDLADIARSNLADILWREKKFAESEALARQVVAAHPAGSLADNARIVLCQAKVDGAPQPSLAELYASGEDEESCGMMPDAEVDGAKKVEGKVQRPYKLYGRPPHYPEEARLDRVEGVVQLDSIIDEDGCIQKLRVCKRLRPALDKAALETVRRWVFKPAVLDDHPVKVYYTLTLNFQVGNSRGPG